MEFKTDTIRVSWTQPGSVSEVTNEVSIPGQVSRFYRRHIGQWVSSKGDEGGGLVTFACARAVYVHCCLLAVMKFFIDPDFNCNQQANSALVKEQIRKLVST